MPCDHYETLEITAQYAVKLLSDEMYELTNEIVATTSLKIFSWINIFDT